MKTLLALAFLAVALPAHALAGFKSSVDFTAAEKAAHARHIGTITKVARQYLEDIWKEHLAFYRKHRVSKFYGDRNLALNTRAERIAALSAAGAPTSLVDQLKPTSCVGLTLEALGAGFKATGDPALVSAWSKALAFTRANALDGCALLHALQKLGWRIAYWNPAPQDNELWDRQDGNRKSKGWHAYRYLTVNRSGTYYFNKVDDKSLLVGFGTKVPATFRSEPFFVGIAHTGYHVFPGFKGDVIEAHSTRRLDSIDNLEKSPFNPLANGGGPRWTASEWYRSGLVGIPPK
jgi:hypothetical protein